MALLLSLLISFILMIEYIKQNKVVEKPKAGKSRFNHQMHLTTEPPFEKSSLCLLKSVKTLYSLTALSNTYHTLHDQIIL